MSRFKRVAQNVQNFRQLVADNKDLQDSVHQCQQNGQWDIQGLVALGKEHDLTLTEEAIETTFSGDSDDELTDFELEMVSASFLEEFVAGAQMEYSNPGT